MKKGILVVAVLSVFSVSMPVFAMEHGSHVMTEEQGQKECEMLIQDCNRQADSIQQQIAKLEANIKKGTSSNKRDELRKLQEKLQETKEMLEQLQSN